MSKKFQISKPITIFGKVENRFAFNKRFFFRDSKHFLYFLSILKKKIQNCEKKNPKNYFSQKYFSKRIENDIFIILSLDNFEIKKTLMYENYHRVGRGCISLNGTAPINQSKMCIFDWKKWFPIFFSKCRKNVCSPQSFMRTTHMVAHPNVSEASLTDRTSTYSLHSPAQTESKRLFSNFSRNLNTKATYSQQLCQSILR